MSIGAAIGTVLGRFGFPAVRFGPSVRFAKSEKK
jgi:hypothetical protein